MNVSEKKQNPEDYELKESLGIYLKCITAKCPHWDNALEVRLSVLITVWLPYFWPGPVSLPKRWLEAGLQKVFYFQLYIRQWKCSCNLVQPDLVRDAKRKSQFIFPLPGAKGKIREQVCVGGGWGEDVGDSFVDEVRLWRSKHQVNRNQSNWSVLLSEKNKTEREIHFSSMRLSIPGGKVPILIATVPHDMCLVQQIPNVCWKAVWMVERQSSGKTCI